MSHDALEPLLRPGCRGDLVALAELSAQASRELGAGWGRDALDSELARPDSRIWVSEVAGSACGGAIARSSGAEIELLWIAVRPDQRRRGIAGRLVEAVVRWSHESGACVRLEVRAANAPARALYAREGFVVVGRRPRYYRDGQDAVLLEHPPRAEVRP